MPGIVVVGLQWGDEGKGKIVDFLSHRAFHIVRSQGGSNAGHTIKAAGKEIALHLVPSGIHNAHAQCYIAGGCLIDPKVLVEEIHMLSSKGIDVHKRLSISPRAHLVFPFHRELDRLHEESKGKKAIGTTRRGIGPCASDKALRIGVRIAELMRPEIFKEKLTALAHFKNLELGKIYGQPPINIEGIFKEFSEYGAFLQSYVKDVEGMLYAALMHDETVLFEGAHGTFLDCLYGSYPFVTSTATLTSGVCEGAGIGPNQIDEVIGVIKAYTTRVGSGPLPTAMDPDTVLELKKVQHFREVGTTTGRERRIGWLDLVLVRYAAAINGVEDLVLTKLDILDVLPEIKICVGYQLDGERIDRPPALIEDFEKVEPIYETLPGWEVSTKEVRKLRDLPKNARKYIEAIEDYCNIAIGMISVGPDREETIEVDEDWV